jgi:hypothetical protein
VELDRTTNLYPPLLLQLPVHQPPLPTPCLTVGSVSTSTCDPCPANCISCISSTVCTQCASQTVASNGLCVTCLSPCATCNEGPTTCASCISGFALAGTSCTSQCPLVGQSIVNSRCICTSGYLYNSQCITTCPIGTGIGDFRNCADCPLNCDACPVAASMCTMQSWLESC